MVVSVSIHSSIRGPIYSYGGVSRRQCSLFLLILPRNNISLELLNPRLEHASQELIGFQFIFPIIRTPMILEAATIDKYFKNEDKRHYTFIYSEYSAEYGLASLRGDDELIK